MKIIKSISLLSMLVVVSLVLVACGGNGNGSGGKEMEEILSRFDLTDPKDIWNGSFGDVTFDGLSDEFVAVIIITFRQLNANSEFPEIEKNTWD